MLCLENGLVIDPSQDIEEPRDLLIDRGKIAAIDAPGSFASTEVSERLDVRGRWIMPGLIDLHVHLREPGQEWKETIRSGTRAAALGGYTAVCSMPNTSPAIHSVEIVEYVLEKARIAGCARVHPIGAVTVDRRGESITPFAELREAGCVAFSDDGDPVYHSGIMRRALEWSRELGVPISCHEEDKHLSCGGSMNESALSLKLGLIGMPKVAEEVMIARDIELARTTGGHAHICHVSSGRGVELIRRAKNDGISVSAEVTPHHLVLTEQAVSEYDTAAKMSPPLREEEEREMLFQGLQDGTIDAVASDHAPHEHDSKNVEFSQAAMGILGLQTSLPLLLESNRRGALSRTQLVRALSTAPAELFHLSAGTLRIGSPADIAVVDPDYEWTFDRSLNASKSWNSPFLDRQLRGAAWAVLVGGDIVVLDYQIQRSLH